MEIAKIQGSRFAIDAEATGCRSIDVERIVSRSTCYAYRTRDPGQIRLVGDGSRLDASR